MINSGYTSPVTMDWTKWTSVFLYFNRKAISAMPQRRWCLQFHTPVPTRWKTGINQNCQLRCQGFGKLIPSKDLVLTFSTPFAPWYPWVPPSLPPPPKAGPKASSKGLRRNLLKGSMDAELRQATWGRVMEPDFFTPPGRGICLAGTWEIYSLSSPSCWIKFLNPSPVGRFA